MKVAIIPARSGSKRIKQKNIRLFRGRPIIEYSITAAQQTGLFDHVIVSTDCNEIAGIATVAGAEVPFRRPDHLADDYTPTIPVVRQAIDWIEQHWRQVELACCIYATAPLVQVDDLKHGHELLAENPNAEFAFPVTPFSFNPFRGVKIVDEQIQMAWPEHELTRSQDLPEMYHDAGQFYWGRPQAFREREGFFNARSLPIVIPNFRVQDIDTEDDWQRAELLSELMDFQQVSGTTPSSKVGRLSASFAIKNDSESRPSNQKDAF